MLSKSSLQRRLKRKILKIPHKFFAVCAPGLEMILRKEIISIPYVEDLRLTRGGVSFSGPLSTVYEANLGLSTAHRILLRIKSFPAHSFPMLFDQLGRIEWELWVKDKTTYRISVSSKASKLNMKQRLIETSRAALENRLRLYGIRAYFDPKAEYEVALRLTNNIATVSFNSSGTHLHKRGYKQNTVAAPIRETLAAAILLHLDYSDYDLLVDPFCGSGTFLLEAARMAEGVPASRWRAFAFMHAPFFDERKLEAAIKRLQVNSPKQKPQKYMGYDISPAAIRSANMNAHAAGLEGQVSFQLSDYRSLDYRELASKYRQKLMVSNPPYGKRVTTWSAVQGEQLTDLVRYLPGWTIALVNPWTQHSRPRPTADSVLRFDNGGLASTLHVLHAPHRP